MPPIGGIPGPQQQPIIPVDAITRLLLQGGDPSNMFSGDPSQQPTTPAPGPTVPSAPPSGVISGSMSGAPTPASQQPTAAASSASTPAQSVPSFAAPEDKQQWLSEHPVATPQPRLGPFDKIPEGQPGADTWANRHNDFRRVLASLFAGAAEYGGAMNHHPGQGAAILDRWADQDQADRQFNATLPAQKQQVENAAYNQYLEQQKGSTDIQKAQAEIPNIRANVPALQRQQEFLDKVRQLKEVGKYPSDLDLFNSVLPEAATVPGMTRQMMVDQINGTKTLGSKYTITRDPQTQAPIELSDRQGNKYSASNLPKDPEAQQMWNDAATAAGNKEKVIEAQEGRKAETAAQAQARAFAQQDTEKGKAQASAALGDINEAKGQQSLIEQLLSGKMNPASQTAAVYKLVGLSQPTGAHRVMPTEVEGWQHLGGWSDRAAQWFANAKSGDQFPPELLPDIISTARTISQNKIKTANDSLQSAATIHGYKVPGSDANGRMDKPEDYAQPQAGAGQGGAAKAAPKGATHTGIGSQDKKKHWLDAQGNDLGVAE